MPSLTDTPWQPIATVVCDDRWAWLRWRGGAETIADLDHDSDAVWWSNQGVTHWRNATEHELDAYWSSVSR